MSRGERSFSIALVVMAVLAVSHASAVHAQLQVSTNVDGYERDADVAVDPTGRFVVVWDTLGDQDGSSTGIFARRFDASGASQGQEFQVNSYTTGEQAHPAIASAANGNFVVVWFNRPVFAIAGQRYDAAGVALGGEFQVSTTANVGFPNFPAVAMNASGEFAVAWEALGHVITRRWDAFGVPVGPEVQVDTTSVSFAWIGVAIDDAGVFTVVWSSQSLGVYARRFDALGSPLGPPLSIDVLGHWPSIAMRGTGDSVVAWTRGSAIFAAQLDAAGIPVNPPFQVNTYVEDDAFLPDVAVATDGSFLITWESRGMGSPYTSQDGSSSGIIARRYDATGSPVSGEFQINSATIGSQDNVAVAGDGSGAFVATWDTTQRYSESLGDVVAQRFDANAVPLEPEPIALNKLLIKDPTGAPSARKLVFVSKAKFIDTTPVRGINPVANGAALHLFNSLGSGEAVCIDLPAAGWTMSGSTAFPKFSYGDPSGVFGPCYAASIKDSRVVKVLCHGVVQPLLYSLDEASQGRIGVAFSSGATTYCGESEGSAVKVDEPGRFLAKRPLEALECPQPPSPCP